MPTSCGSIVGRQRGTCPKCLGDDIPNGSCVYFLEANGKIKIGFSKCLASRIQTVRSASMLDVALIGWVAGDRVFEKVLHLAAAEYRVKGEWFIDCEPVRSIINMAMDGGASVFSRAIERQTRKANPDVAWAAEQLRSIAGSRSADDTVRSVIQRVARKIGASYWRTFDLWYEKAHRLEIYERNSIIAAGEVP